MNGRITDEVGADKFGYTWDDARHHTQSTLRIPAGEAATLVEELATSRLLEPYQIIQATPKDFVELKNRATEQ